MKNTFKKPAMHSKTIIAVIVIIALGMVSCASMSIESVDWTSLTGPAKVRQYFSVSTTDVTVYANYKDGSRKEVTFFSTSHNRESTGTQTVTVNVLGQGTGTFQTEVMELLSIRIESPPSKTTYTVGERADLAGIKVMGSWRDMLEAEIPTYEITVAGFNSNTAGTNRQVTIDYKGKTATFPVTVTAAPAPAAATPAPTATTPSTQQQSASIFNPAPNQPSPVGTWRNNQYTNIILTLNANGTGIYSGVDITWTASGNKLTINYGGGIVSDFKYEITGNTLTWGAVLSDGTTADTVRFTRQ